MRGLNGTSLYIMALSCMNICAQGSTARLPFILRMVAPILCLLHAVDPSLAVDRAKPRVLPADVCAADDGCQQQAGCNTTTAAAPHAAWHVLNAAMPTSKVSFQRQPCAC